MTNSRNDTNRLIGHLYAVMNNEAEKPFKEIDAELIEACTELILELQGKNFTLSNEEIEERVRKIPFVDTEGIKPITKKKIKTKKILLIAAIITIICVLFAIASTGFEWGFIDRAKEKFGSVFNVPTSQEQIDGNFSYEVHGPGKTYNSVDDFWENEDINILIPSDLPDGINIETIYVDNLNDHYEISLRFDKCVSNFTVTLDKKLSTSIVEFCDDKILINNLTCHIAHLDDVQTIQIHFEHNGNLYIIGGNDEQALLNIIENLEEKQ